MLHSYTLRFRPGYFAGSIASSLLLLILVSGKVTAQLPPNIDFSSGNFSNWKCWVGIATSGAPATGTFFDSARISAPIGGNAPSPSNVNKSRHFITSGTDTDYYGGFPIVSPAGGLHSLRVGNDSPNYRADRVQYFIHVPSGTTSFNLQCQYAIVLEDPSHNPEDQPTFQVVAYDSATGAILPAANNLYIAHYAVPGFLFNRAPILNPVADSFIYYLPWTTTTVNLSGMGGKTVTLECTALDCSLGGHFCYGYFDVISTADTLMASIIRYNNKGDSVLLQGPAGYKAYQWYNQDFSNALNEATDTSQTRFLPTPTVAQYYNLVITPYASIGVPDTIHTPILTAYTLGLSTVPLTAVSAYPNPANGMLHISFSLPFEGTLNLFNSAGQSVYTTSLSKSSSHDISTGSFAIGVYNLVLKNNEGVINTLKVSIKH